MGAPVNISRDEILTLMQAGKSVGEAAKALGVTAFTLKKYARKHELCQPGQRPFKQITRSKQHCEHLAEALRGKPLDEKRKQKIAETLKGRKRSEDAIRKTVAAIKGRNFSEEHKRKISEANKGKSVSEETRRKLSAAFKGKPGPWLGKTRSLEYKAEMSAKRKGHPLSEYANARALVVNKGRKLSKEVKAKMSIAGIARCSKMTPGQRSEIAAKARAAVSKQKRTNIECIMADALSENDIEYKEQYRIGWCIVDFYIPTINLVIECDGEYWHNYPSGTDKDGQRDAYLTKLGYAIERFWERKILQDIETCIKVIKRKYSMGAVVIA